MEHITSSRRRAFTLIELLTVIAIVAVLAAILFPVFATVREQARQANTMSNLHNVYVASRLFYEDEGAYPDVLFGYAMTTGQSGANGNDGMGGSGSEAGVPDQRPAKPGDSPVVPMNQAVEQFGTGSTLNTGYLYGEQIKDYNTFLNADNLEGGNVVNDPHAVTEAYYPLNSPYSIAKGGTAANPILVTWEADNVTNPQDGCEWYGDSDLPDSTYAAASNGSATVETPKLFYKMDTMDIGPMLDANGKWLEDSSGNYRYELHYSPSWTHELYKPANASASPPTGACDVDGSGNPITNQLKYKLPPTDRTVITYVTNHAASAGSSRVIVLLDDGTARKISLQQAAQQLPLGYTP